jgi:hypothetical protein
LASPRSEASQGKNGGFWLSADLKRGKESKRRGRKMGEDGKKDYRGVVESNSLN